MWRKMGNNEQAYGKTVEKINILNEIFENVISGTSDPVKTFAGV
jgi:hypothetical protein